MTVEGAMSFLRRELAQLGIEEDWRLSDAPDTDELWGYGRVFTVVCQYNGEEISASVHYTVPVPEMGEFLIADLQRQIECLSSPTTTA